MSEQPDQITIKIFPEAKYLWCFFGDWDGMVVHSAKTPPSLFHRLMMRIFFDVHVKVLEPKK